MSRFSVRNPLSLTKRNRKKSQVVSEDSFCDVPLLESPRRNTVLFPSTPQSSPSTAKTTPSRSTPVPTSPSLRKLALLSSYVGCACSKDSLLDDGFMKPNSHPEGVYVDEQEKRDVNTSSADIKALSHRSKSRRTVNRNSVIPTTQCQPSSDMESEKASPSPPVLALPTSLGENLDNSLGWTDEFGIRLENHGAPHLPWLTSGRTFSHYSQRTTWSQPSRPASRQSQSRDFLNAQEESLALKTPLTVLETDQGGFTEWTMSSVIFAEADTSSLRRDTSQVRFKEHVEEFRPPQVNFQVRASDDWAARVLKAFDETNDL